MRAGDMRPAGVEIWFGYGNKTERSTKGKHGEAEGRARALSLPVLTIQTPGTNTRCMCGARSTGWMPPGKGQRRHP